MGACRDFTGVYGSQTHGTAGKQGLKCRDNSGRAVSFVPLELGRWVRRWEKPRLLTVSVTLCALGGAHPPGACRRGALWHRKGVCT